MILLGDCLERLRELPDNSVDSCVTDPPYGLSKEPDVAEVMQHWINGDKYEHKSKGFMGKSWDSFVPGPEYWREVYRVLKPGAHICVFAGTRTWDIMSCALRFAGFQNRDTIASFGGPPGLAWTFGSGFPKSHDVSKAIDKAAGARGHDAKGFNAAGVESGLPSNGGSKFRSDHPEYVKPKGVTEDAKQWQGWGTALKPAWEVVLIFRKPLEGTVARNVLKYGTGALNIDESRIGVGEIVPGGGKSKRGADNGMLYGNGEAPTNAQPHAQGRWPANVLFDEEAAAVLDEQSGVAKPKAGRTGPRGGRANIEGGWDKSFPGEWPADPGGGASRFFKTITQDDDDLVACRFLYQAKASKRERNAGLEGMPEKQSAGLPMRSAEGERGGVGGDGSSTDRLTKNQNHHPTVKPLKLMEYLIKLVTPPGGTVLDPFAGSGSTLVAAFRLGYQAIGCEMNPEYVEIAEKRTAHAKESR